jgi:hypothetical protein
MAYQRKYCKAEILQIIKNQGWYSNESTGSTNCTTIRVGIKGDGACFGIFDNFDAETAGEDSYTFTLTVNA